MLADLFYSGLKNLSSLYIRVCPLASRFATQKFSHNKHQVIALVTEVPWQSEAGQFPVLLVLGTMYRRTSMKGILEMKDEAGCSSRFARENSCLHPSTVQLYGCVCRLHMTRRRREVS